MQLLRDGPENAAQLQKEAEQLRLQVRSLHQDLAAQRKASGLQAAEMREAHAAQLNKQQMQAQEAQLHAAPEASAMATSMAAALKA